MKISQVSDAFYGKEPSVSYINISGTCALTMYHQNDWIASIHSAINFKIFLNVMYTRLLFYSRCGLEV